MTYLPTDTSASVLTGAQPARAAAGSEAASTRLERSETAKPDLTKKPAGPEHAEAFAAPAAGTARVEPAGYYATLATARSGDAPGTEQPDTAQPDTAPEPGRLIGVTLWGLALTLIGLVVSVCVVMLSVTSTSPGAFTAALLMIPICGLLGLGLVIASLVTITRG